MKIKALIDCVGLGYNLKKDDEADLNPKTASKLIKFGYVVEVQNHENGQEDPRNDNMQLTVDELPNKSGWYELPNGEKIQGKEKAEEALAELYKEKSEE